MQQSIPLVNLERQYQSIKAELFSEFEKIFERSAFVQGEWVRAFEAEFVKRQGLAHGVGCSNGTSALEVVIEALGLRAGDEVITTPLSFFATVEPLCRAGVKPVFVDVDPQTYSPSIQALKKAVTSKTRALLPVHLYGMPVDLDAWQSLAQAHQLLLIEDCAQAHLAKFKGRGVGSFGDASTFSFYPGKNLGAAGDAGFIGCSSTSVAERVRRLIDHGRLEKYTHGELGWNARMDGLQAAVLSQKLKHIDHWTSVRLAHAGAYRSELTRRGFQVPQVVPGAEPVWHLLVVETSNRDETLKHLQSQGIQAGVHYPVPLHQQPALKNWVLPNEKFVVTERICSRILSLPLCGELTAQEREHVLKKFFEVAKP